MPYDDQPGRGYTLLALKCRVSVSNPSVVFHLYLKKMQPG